MVTTDIGVVFSLLFFGIFFAYLSYITNAASCQDPTQQFNDTDSNIAINPFGYYEYAKMIYNGLAFKGCDMKQNAWFSVISISCVGTSIYMILRLVRGGG